MSAKVTEHFSMSEIECHCGCGQSHIDSKLMKMAEALRKNIDKPMITHCVNRCRKHNRNVGGVDNSLHIPGEAMDFHCKGLSVKKLHLLCMALWKTKTILTGGLGIYDWGVHIDSGSYRTWRG